MQKISTEIDGCFILKPKVFEDFRGSFIKTYQRSIYESFGLKVDIKEEFFSFSKASVVRGMHFQTPPFEHDKLVSCLKGKVLDVVLDLRQQSSTYLKFCTFELSSYTPSVLFIPSGCAHGFLSLEDDSCMFYQTTSEHNVQSDTGIHWNSFGFHWPVENAVVSARDESLVNLDDFKNPF